MGKLDRAYEQIKKAIDIIQASPILDPIAESAVESIPIAGPILAKYYNKYKDSKETDPRKDVLQALQAMQHMNEAQLESFCETLQDNNALILEQKGYLRKIVSTQSQILDTVTDIADGQKTTDKKLDAIREAISSEKRTKNIVGKVMAVTDQPKLFSEDYADKAAQILHKWFNDAKIKVNLGANFGIKKEDLFIVVYSDITKQELEILDIASVDETLVEITAKSVQRDYSICKVTSLAYNKLEVSRESMKNKLGLHVLGKDAKIDVELADKIDAWVNEGQWVVLVPREEKLVHDELDDLYHQTLDEIPQDERAFYYREIERRSRKYLLNYPHSYFTPNALFRQGFAQFKLGKFNESIETFSLFLEQYPFHVSAPGAKEWIFKAEARLKMTAANESNA